MFAPDDIATANSYITMTGSDVFDNPNETEINVLWFSFTETTDEQFGCFAAIGSGRVLKKEILFPLSDNDNNDIIHLTDTCCSRILNSINPQTPTACATAEFVESESEYVKYIDVEATEIRSRRERGIRKRRNEDMVYY